MVDPHALIDVQLMNQFIIDFYENLFTYVNFLNFGYFDYMIYLDYDLMEMLYFFCLLNDLLNGFLLLEIMQIMIFSSKNREGCCLIRSFLFTLFIFI